MRSWYCLLLFIVISNFVLSQDKTVNIHFSPTFGNQQIESGTAYYLPSINDSVKIEAFRFYLSGISLFGNNNIIGSPVKEFILLDIDEPASLSFSIDSLHSDSFDTLSFQLGVDSLTNVSGAQGGDLDPINGMYWTWQSGYINFKLEGSASICPSRNNQFQFHIGGYQAPNATIQIVQLTVATTDTITINLAIDQLLNGIDLANTYQVMSPNQNAVNIAHMLPAIISIKE